MSLSDCEKCWDTPCRCGYGYLHFTLDEKLDLCGAILGIDKRDLEKSLSHIIEDSDNENDMDTSRK